MPKPAGALHNRLKTVGTTNLLDLRAEAAQPAEPVAAITRRPNHLPAEPPKKTVQERHIAQFTDRFEQAKRIGRSPLVNKYANYTDKLGHLSYDALTGHDETSREVAREEAHHAITGGASAHAEMPPHAVTHHEAMTRLAPTPPPTLSARPSVASAWRPHLSMSPRSGRAMATSAAVLIMGSYVWLQNYPKLAIQSASSRAGVAASLPGYIPSSYNLSRTDTSPGMVSLSYGSPSLPDPLKISQQRTSWDSSSLLDNFVTKNTDDYATVEGQGLTIYLFNNNQATWVNHGIWYSIAGATRLSREQILKIAYSL
jgi:hypothetical protein